MTELSPAQSERARRLHQESFVADYVPRGEHLGPTLTPRLERLMQDALAGGTRATVVWERMEQERTLELQEDPSVRVRMGDYWQQAGVNCVTVTLSMGGIQSAPGDAERVWRHIAQWQRRIEAGGYMALVAGAGQALTAWREGRVGVMLALQDTVMLPRDLALLDTLHTLGLRVIQLTYNLRNFIGDGCTERTQAGLSHFGVEFVRRMNRLGMVVDLSHCGYQTTIDAIEVSERPVAVTHSFCRALRDHPRGKTDDQLRLLAERDGFFGVLMVVSFLADDPCPPLDVFLDHVDHAVSILGQGRVGIGTDWGSSTPDIPEPLRIGVNQAFLTFGFRPEQYRSHPGGQAYQEMQHFTQWPAITRGLVSRGYGDEEIRGLLGQNWLRFLERAGSP